MILRASLGALKGAAARRIRPLGVCNFGIFDLQIDRRDRGGTMYESLDYWADLASPVEAEIVKFYRPTLYVDVGANYGFTTLCHHALNPHCRLVLIEPSPQLLPHLRRNLKANGLSAEVIPLICSDRAGPATLSLNPVSSQDNRVVGEGWEIVRVGATTLDAVLADRVGTNDFVYIKVDTQGFEERVMAGGEAFLGVSASWIMRSEFAPYWLRSQGTEPVEFLTYLVDRYSVSELPRRARFRGDGLESIRANELSSVDVRPFAAYVEGLAKDRGWCDLLIAPRDVERSSSV